MSNTGVNAVDRSKYLYTEQVKTANQELGKDQFLQILMTQLQNQDPTAPMDNSQMIAQMAQFSSLEAMNNMSTAFSQNQSYNMIGKVIVGVMRDEVSGITTDVYGRVDSAGVMNGKPYVKVGDATVQLSNIHQVFDASVLEGNAQTITNGAAMVGKYVRAEIAEGNNKTTVEGQISKLIIKDGVLFVKVGERELALFQLKEISNEPFPAAETPDPPAETAPAETPVE